MPMYLDLFLDLHPRSLVECHCTPMSCWGGSGGVALSELPPTSYPVERTAALLQLISSLIIVFFFFFPSSSPRM